MLNQDSTSTFEFFHTFITINIKNCRSLNKDEHDDWKKTHLNIYNLKEKCLNKLKLMFKDLNIIWQSEFQKLAVMNVTNNVNNFFVVMSSVSKKILTFIILILLILCQISIMFVLYLFLRLNLTMQCRTVNIQCVF